MDVKLDRRQIVGLLNEHFPGMFEAGTASDGVHGLLNEVTGLSIPLDEPNATAFDKWRQALSSPSAPVWGISPERAENMRIAAERLKTRYDEIVAARPQVLAALQGDAPGGAVTV